MTAGPQDGGIRKRAVEDLDQTLFIEASAGTGKTTLLVDRVVQLVVSGTARMDQIAAITFTEAAAAELRDRLSQEFDRASADDQGGRAAAAAAALESSAVTTLHGFARKILAEHPFPVGLPPLFEVADASSSRVAFDERWSRFVNSMLESDGTGDLVARALSCGMTWKQLKGVAQRCDENWDRLTPPDVPTAPPPSDPTLLVQLLERAVGLRDRCTNSADGLAVHLADTTAHQLRAIRGAAGDLDLLQVLAGIDRLTANGKGKKTDWTVPGNPLSVKDEVLDALRDAEAERARLVDANITWMLATLFDHIIAFTNGGVDERRATGRLAFHDLLVWGCRLVRDHPAPRLELQARYTHILIDEFQDTDPIQAELALYLASDGATDGIAWVDLPVPPGRLFFVGDPKQSIYRFRRADIELFLKIKNRGNQEVLALSTNFRSRPAIVDWVNAAFKEIFGAGEPGRQPAYEELVAFEDKGCDNPAGLRPVIVLGKEAMDDSATTVRSQQAREVVAAIATMHAQQWVMGPTDQREQRAMRYDDVAILVRTRTGLPILEDAFRAAGVPYRLESSSLVYESEEVQQLLALLRAIDDPTDSLSVLTALRSPAFGCGDDDLYRHAAGGGRWDPQSPTGRTGPVGDALAELRQAHEGRWWRSVGEMVSAVASERRLMALALGGPRARESWRRIRYLVDQARMFDETDGGDLRAFLRWVGHQQGDEARVTEAILPETDDDAVRVLTMHAAKGLQFPVTVLLGLGRISPGGRPPVLFGADGAEVCVKKGFETPGYEMALAAERVMEGLELRRLLYVAATRARDVVVVSLHREKKVKDSLATQLIAACDQCPELWDDGSVLCQPRSEEPSVAAPAADMEQADFSTREDFERERAALLARAKVPRTVAATGVKSLQTVAGSSSGVEPVGSTTMLEPLERAETGTAQRRGRAGTAIGRAVHGVLQVIDLATGAELENLCRAQAVAEGVAHRESEIRDLVRAALASDLVGLAVSSGRYWREVYVGIPVGERVLEGFIDLLIDTPDGLVVVDYKTDRVGGDTDDVVVLGRYGLQGASYALAVATALEKPVTRCSFLLLHQQGSHEVRLPELQGAVAEVRRLLSRDTA